MHAFAHYIPTKSDLFILKISAFPKENNAQISAHACHAVPKKRHLHRNATGSYMGLCNIHVSVQPSTEHDTLITK